MTTTNVVFKYSTHKEKKVIEKNEHEMRELVALICWECLHTRVCLCVSKYVYDCPQKEWQWNKTM